MDKYGEPTALGFFSSDGELLRQLLECLPVGVWIADGQGRILLGNRSGEALWGGARYVGLAEYSAYRGWWADSGAALKAEDWPLARAAVRGETRRGAMIEIQGFDGSQRTILSSAAPLRDANGQQVGALSVHQDVTDLKQLQDSLKQEAAFSAAVLDTVAALVVVLDREGLIVRFNSESSRLTGYRPEEVVGRHFADFLIPEEDRETARARFRQLRGRDFPHTYENCWLSRDGQRRRIVWRNASITNDAGRLDYVVACGMDVTEQRRTEADLLLAQKAFEASGEAIMVTDTEGRIVSVNQAFTAITGHRPEAVIGQSPRILRSGRHGPEFYAALWQSLRNEGRWQGEIWDRRADGSVYPKWLTITAVRDGGRSTHYVAVFSDISERKAKEERIRHLAEHDALTGLANRNQLHTRLVQEIERAGRSGRHFALLFLDLDRFKAINDTFGHEVGDELLIMVGTRLRGAVRNTDLVSRLGGDEFVVLLTDLEDNLAAGRTADKLLGALSLPFFAASHQLQVTPSIGVAVYPGDGSDGETLLRHADLAMYEAKQQGRAMVRFFIPALNERAAARASLEQRLGRALAQGDFVLHYQPQVELPGGRITGLEALVRWQDGEVLRLPEDFIPAAEASGLILPLGDWVLNEACRQMQAWRQAGLPPLPVAVNLSAREFLQPDLPRRVAAALAAAGLEPGALELELTESVAMADVETTGAVLQELAAMGVALAIDDFGTGYASLDYLKRFPVRRLKVDRSFVQDLEHGSDNAAIVSAIIGLSRGLGLRVVAEGVETPAQREFLHRLGCHAAQGYLFAHPLPPEAVAQVLAGAPGATGASAE